MEDVDVGKLDEEKFVDEGGVHGPSHVVSDLRRVCRRPLQVLRPQAYANTKLILKLPPESSSSSHGKRTLCISLWHPFRPRCIS